MPIAKKVMIMYAFLFTITIIVISAILLFTAKGMGVGITFTTLQNCSESIENYILSGNKLTEENIETIVGESYIDYIIEDRVSNKVYISQNFLPDNSTTPMEREDFSDNIEEDFNLREKSSKKPYFKILGNYDSYNVYTKNGHEFISIENEFECNGTIYTVKLFKAVLDNMYYVKYIALRLFSESIENYILSGNKLTEENIETIVGESYIDYIIEDRVSNKVYISQNFLPDNSTAPMEREDFSDNIEEDFNLREKSSKKPYFKILGNYDSYNVYTKNGHEFISIENEFEYNGTIYTVKLFKAVLDNMYYVKYIALRLFYVNILGIILAALMGSYISNVMLKPIRKIKETAKRISVEDLSQRIEIDGPDDEIKELSVTFNSMIDRLEESFEQQSRFVSDASHELRTPISVINGYANLINRWGKDDPEILQEAVNNILEETDHMSVMIKNLLFLAKSDQNRNHVQKQPMSINEAVYDIAKDLSVTDERIEVITEVCDKELIISGDPDLIKQMLWIYTENAVKYSGDKKVITYKVYTEGDYACVSVKDNGCGISEEDIQHIFDRFYRADKSRNKEIPGNGLGLSIASWIINTHNGKVEVKSVVGQGTEFISKFKLE